MIKKNENILKKLEDRTKSNAEQFKTYLSQWSKKDKFPCNELKRYIRFNEWEYKDFGFENELLVRKHLEDWVLDVFFEVKEFRQNSRNELTSTQFAYAKLTGYPCDTQNEKAFCVYTWAFDRYFGETEINRE